VFSSKSAATNSVELNTASALEERVGAMKPLDHVVDEKLQPGQGSKAMFSSKKIQDFSSYRIFGHMYGALNVDEKN
jgi:hypothetical protein